MKRFRNVMTWTIIGAVIGGSISSLIAILMLSSQTGGARFIVEAILTVGAGGGIGGAICGVIVGLLSNKTIGAVLGGGIGGIGGRLVVMSVGGILGFFAIMIGMLWYSHTPWPSPKAFPGVEAMIRQGATGSWGFARTCTYTVDSSLDEVQRYYEDQMNHYCKDDWQFEMGLDCDEYPSCREASCEIHRLWIEQFFDVHLYPVSDKQTKVVHVDWWED